MSDLLHTLFYYTLEDTFKEEDFIKMWNYDRDQFISIMFYLRSHKNTNHTFGRGIRKIFYHFLLWMSHQHLYELLIFIPFIPSFGYWKDLLILMDTPAEYAVIQLFSIQLQNDYDNYIRNLPITLLAKWTPNEHSSYDKKYNVCSKLCTAMMIDKKTLRKKYLVPLRNYLHVTEQLITTKKWEMIDYSTLPKKCLQFHKSKFLKYDYDRFLTYMNTNYKKHIQHIYPPEIIKLLLFSSDRSTVNNVVNSDTLFAIDISGSMSGFPMIIAASLCVEMDNSQWIPFSLSDTLTIENIYPIVFPTKNIYDNFKSIMDSIHEPLCPQNSATCIDIAGKINKKHIIIITNLIPSVYELPKSSMIDITYWIINNNPPIITEHDNITIVNGYNTFIYQEFISKNRISSTSYKNLILAEISKKHLFPSLAA
jgi:hypothetical protein